MNIFGRGGSSESFSQSEHWAETQVSCTDLATPSPKASPKSKIQRSSVLNRTLFMNPGSEEEVNRNIPSNLIRKHFRAQIPS